MSQKEPDNIDHRLIHSGKIMINFYNTKKST